MRVFTLLVLGVAAQIPSPPVPFTLHRDHLILVRGEVHDLDDLVFMLDTGSGRTLLNAAHARTLGLAGKPAHLSAFGGTVEGHEVVLSELRLARMTWRNHPVIAVDLSTTAAPLGLPRLDGILGIDLIRPSGLAIDFVRRELLFGHTRSVAYRARLVAHPVFFVVEARVDGAPARLIVDTGASHPVLFKRSAPEPSAPGAAGAAQLGGSTSVRVSRVQELRLGDWSGRGLTVLETSAPVVQPAPARTDGLFALPALGATWLQIDVSRQELGWRR